MTTTIDRETIAVAIAHLMHEYYRLPIHWTEKRDKIMADIDALIDRSILIEMEW